MTTVTGGSTAPEWGGLVRDIERHLEEARSTVNSILASVPAAFRWAADAVHDAWNWLMDRADELWKVISDPYRRPGDRAELRSLIGRWRTDAASELANLTRRIDPNSLATDDEWAGKGAQKYQQAVAAQRTTLTGFESAISTPVTASLEKLAGGLDVFTTLMYTTLGTLIGGLIAGIGCLAGIVTAPAAIITMVTAIAAALVQIISANVQLDNAISAAQSQIDGVAERATAWPGFASQ